MNTGKKDDHGKLRYSLVKPEALRELAEVLMNGANKYGDDNYLLVEDKRYLDALMRHFEAYRMGQRIDEDSGRKTMAHVVACAFILLQKELEADKGFKIASQAIFYTDEELAEMQAEHLVKHNIVYPK